jgi:type IV pilus assembly protein PilV
MSRRLSRQLLAAYTVVEVMMAMSVLAIGATGVIAMQKATLIGNVRARDLMVGNAVSAAWIERLRADGKRWVINDDNTTTIAQTTWLNLVGNDDFPTLAAPEGQWIRPVAVPAEDVSFLADVRGADTDDLVLAGFCTNIRLNQLTPRMIRAEVRVYWLKSHGVAVTPQTGGTLGGTALCDEDLALVGAERHRYHFVYMTTGILATE